MPVLALAMLVANYSYHHGWVNEIVLAPDPQFTSISSRYWKDGRANSNQPSENLVQPAVMVAVFEN